MVPLGTLATIKKSFGPQIVNRYNLYPAASITGEPAAGAARARLCNSWSRSPDRNIPAHMGYEWTGMAYQEKHVGSEAILVFVLAVLLVYLVLAAQYESWFIPWAVILVVPLGAARRRRRRRRFAEWTTTCTRKSASC